MSGVSCPACGRTARIVVESRPLTDRIRRRVQCSNCDERFTTYELRGDQITQQSHGADAAKAARLIGQVQALERSIATLRSLLDAELTMPVAASQATGPTCEDCTHWTDRCGLGFPDPAEEGIEFAQDCASFATAT